MRILCTGGSGFIGTNFVDGLLELGVSPINLDVIPPVKHQHQEYWVECDILDERMLRSHLDKFRPTHVVHFAARTDVLGKDLIDYRVNTEGTANLLVAIAGSASVERLVITSTQFVLGPGRLPTYDEDFDPHTVYGLSKVIAEQLTRSAKLNCVWTIIRPTNIWGPWHPRYPYEFWRILSTGKYFHPGRQPVIRCYGYVKNVTYQIQKILAAPPEIVDRKVYYVGDRPLDVYVWANGFSKAVIGRDVRVVPRSIVRAMAIIGDLASMLGMQLPIYSSRFRSMTTDYLTPMEPTFQAFGEPPYSLDEGIVDTTDWLRTQNHI